LRSALAQFGVELGIPQEQFLPGETVTVAVRITNLSGQPMHLGREADWLTFSVESLDGHIVMKSGDIPVTGEFAIESSKSATKKLDLTPYYSFLEMGRYTIVASVKVKEWNDMQRYSAPRNFNLIHGTTLWEQEFGVPVPRKSSDTNAPAVPSVPEVRKYMLQQANWARGQLRLYVRVTNPAETRIFRVVPIGGMYTFSQPEARLDKTSNLHLMYANGARTYSYTEVDPNGEITEQKTYEYSGSRPRLHIDEDGAVSVLGGVRREAASDWPPPSTGTNDSPKANP
jgi:hypothetical protein